MVFSCADGTSALALSRSSACVHHGGIGKASLRQEGKSGTVPSKTTKTKESAYKQYTGAKFCEATIDSSGDGTDILRCGASACQSEYPAGRVSSFECNGDKCPVSNGTYAASCEARKFNSGCSVTYKDVTACKAP
jgi:hypothetical protein